MNRTEGEPIPHRRLQLFCVGPPKCGTHSLAAMFAKNYRSAHEPASEECMEIILNHAALKLNDKQVEEWLQLRDSAMQLEVESSNVVALLARQLVSAFPEGKFILTVREPLSWLDSQINHHLVKRLPEPGSTRMRFRDFRFHGNLGHPAEEAALKRRNLYTLDGYFSYWASHIGSVIRAVPKERLLILNTQAIATSLERIASFANVDAGTLDSSKTHEYSNPTKFNVLAEVNRPYLNAKVQQHCGGILPALFPPSQENSSVRT